ncbi:MAG: aminodeoxychorismate synthase component I [Flavobacteriales bacterium]|nr:aminodeoxychorismate synthase component I [Flavobacteriales bacterium]MDG1767378.1 aminodeoxychorismate synthase component I [Flavobacteriales bacterium]
MKSSLNVNFSNPALFTLFDAFIKKSGWKMGYLSYDLKNQIEDLRSPSLDPQGMPSLYFVQPEMVFEISHGDIKIIEGEHHPELETVIQRLKTPCNEALAPSYKLSPRITKETYLSKLNQIKDYIQRGEIYEVNFCQEFFHHDAVIEPFDLYQRVHSGTKAPFSAFFDWGEHSIMCGSPERYLKKIGSKLISQPIKGTVRRGADVQEDEVLKAQLSADPKERSENIMITDLVRNDLSKVAKKGSVQVDELCGIYTFETVHQMITTISAELKECVSIAELIQASFPMGSMTGAPKVRAMEIIDELEVSKRGVYSGAMGYIDPEGNMDFNVVIRSLLYNKKKRYLSALVGGAITAASDPEKEYEECLLKAQALFKALHE